MMSKRCFHQASTFYATPADAFHISMVMLHDVRPTDMHDSTIRNSVIPEPKIEDMRCKIRSALRHSEFASYELYL